MLVRTVEVCPKQKCTEESVEDMVTRCVEALFAKLSSKVNTKAEPGEALAEVSGSVEVPARYTNRPAWWPRNDKPSYANSMSDTSGVSHDDLEIIVMNLRKQSMDDDQGSVSDESDYYESDDADQVLSLGDHILPVAESYWCADYKFSNLHEICWAKMSGSCPQSLRQLLPTGVKWNCRLYSSLHQCRLSS